MSSQVRSILIAGVALCFLWSLTIPLWHFPDEQAHFAQVQDYAEVKTLPKGNDLSLELYLSELSLGTLRDGQGRNQYTPTPGYQLPLSNVKWGYQEDYLRNLNLNTRKIFVKQEAPHYPPLYYILGAFAYEQVIYADLFTRVFVTRFVSVILFGFLIFASWLVTKELFPKNKNLQLATLAAITFHPMLMFVSAGVNNDVLMNLIATFLIAKSLTLLRRCVTPLDLLHLIILVIAGILTKQQLYLLFPMVGIALGISWWKFSRNWKLAIGVMGTCLGGIVAYLLTKQFNQGFWLPYWPQLTTSSGAFTHALIQVLTRTYRETLPWYWGVYRWLGLVLPLWLLRLIKVVMAASLVGYFIKMWKQRKLSVHPQLIQFIWIIVLNMVYIAALLIWETINVANQGFGHGLQGRYFFPLISTHMALLIAGLWSLGGKKLGKWFPGLVTFSVASLNLFSLWYVLGAYYNRSTFNQLVIEISQYKPDFAKWPNLAIPVTICLFCLLYMAKEIAPRKWTGKKS